MNDLVEYIVKNIVNNPDDVVVEEHTEDRFITLVLSVNPADMGLVIGKGGAMIKAIRKLITVRAMADNVRVNLTLNDPQKDAAAPAADDEAAATEE